MSPFPIPSRRPVGDPGTALVFAARALDILVAQADRMLVPRDHAARAIPPREFRARLPAHLRVVLARPGEEPPAPGP